MTIDRRTQGWLVVAVLVVATAGTARADGAAGSGSGSDSAGPAAPAPTAAAPVTPAPASGGEPPATFHQGQVGLSVRFSVGERFVAPLNAMIYCGATDSSAQYGYASVCTGRSPLALDLEGAYGIAKHIELLAELRIGVEKDFGSTPSASNAPRAFHLAPGARFFFGETAHTKLFVQPMLLIDLAGYNTAVGSRGTEVGLRGMEGYWIDLHRTYGFYFFIAEEAGFTPWLIGEFAGGVGIQGRYP